MATITLGRRALTTAVATILLASTLASHAEADGSKISNIAHSRPVPGGVTRAFDPPEKRWQKGHRGVDLAAEPGARILASADGTVHFAGSIGGITSVSILHADGIRTTYQPVRTELKKGDRVAKGQVIAVLESNPKHPEPGLHWGALRGQDYLNPLDLLLRRPIVLKPAI